MTFSWIKPLKTRVQSISVILLVFLFSGLFSAVQAQDAVDKATWDEGKSLFKSHCQSCHLPDKKVTGPQIKGTLDKWSAEADYEGKTGKEWLYAWIKNWKTPVEAGMPYAVEMAKFDASEMQLNPTLTEADIDKILYYADNFDYVDPSLANGPTNSVPTQAVSTFPMKKFMWILVIGLLLVAFILWRVVSSLNRLSAEREGRELAPAVPIWKNKKVWTVLGIFAFVLVAYVTASNAIALGRQQDYQPEQPIKYSHELHAGTYQIECQYCHSAASESKHSNIPSINVCMNCHKNIQSGPQHGRKEIAKIYSAIGYNPNTMTYFEDGVGEDVVKAALAEYLSQDYEEGKVNNDELSASIDNAYEMFDKPVEWVRIHNLPDHVYFNHAQHVNAGNVECQTCHGNIQEMEVVAQHAPLSMGWCINCHRETEVDMGNSYYQVYEKYHEDLKSGAIDKVTVEDIGGTECQKCHY